MDSSAIYVPASRDLVVDLRWNMAALERRAFMNNLVPDMMKWEWRDSVTGETLAPAFDEPPKLPKLRRWPTDWTLTWDDLPDREVEDITLIKDTLWSIPIWALDCVLVYEYA
jgi:hypothetical protein